MKIAARGLSGIFLLTMLCSLAEARPEEKRFGFGVSHIGNGQTPQLSLAWKSSQATSVLAHTGFSTRETTGGFEVGAQFNRNLFIEENQDFYFYIGASMDSEQRTGGASVSGYSLQTGAGSEIFLSGLPNFGLNFSGGFALSTAGGTQLETRVAFGMHYYF